MPPLQREASPFSTVVLSKACRVRSKFRETRVAWKRPPAHITPVPQNPYRHSESDVSRVQRQLLERLDIDAVIADCWQLDTACDATDAGEQIYGEKRIAQIWPACCLSVFVGLLLVGPVNGAEEPLVLPLWPGAVPADYGTIGPERVRAPSEASTKNAKWITNVTKPTVTIFRPARDKNTGAAMVICPGGGYWNLAWDLEGEEVAAWLNTVGVTGIVLKYRVPRRLDQPEQLPAPGPLLDAQRTISLVRNRAAEWGIDPNRIGIVGFSAGGHLALATATHFDQRGYEPIDEIDKISCRPDFAVAVYPGYLIAQHPAGVETNKNILAPYIRIPNSTPPIFLVHATDDPVAGAENSVVMYLALKQANVSAELHVFAAGGHGFGVRQSSLPCSTWTDRCVAWLQNQGVLGTNAQADASRVKKFP